MTEPMQSVGDLLSGVKVALDASTGVVVGKVLDAMVDAEVAARKDALLAVIRQYEELTREGYKLKKPDVETFDAEGKVAAANFSKARIEELKKHREKLEKVERAIAKAFEGDFSKVKEMK